MGVLLLPSDCVNSGSPLLLQSSARIGPTLFVPDFLRPGSVLLSRSSTRSGSSSAAFGAAWLEASTLVLAVGQSESASSSRSLAQPELVFSALDFLNLGSLPSARSLTKPGVTPSAPDLLNLDSSVLLRCATRLESTLFVFSRAVVGSSTSALDLLHLGLSVPSRSLSHLGPMLLAFSGARLDALLPVLEEILSGSVALLRSFARPGSSPLALDTAQAGPSLPFHSLSWPGSVLSTTGASCPGFPSVVPDCATLDLPLPPRGHACSDVSVLALDLAHSGPVALLRSSSHLGPSLLAPDLLQTGPPPLMQDSVQLGLLLLALGSTRLGFVFPLLVTDFVRPGISISPRSSSQVDLVLLATDSLHPELLLSARGSTCSDPSSAVLDRLKLGSMLLPKSHSRVGSTPLLLGLARAALSTLILDFVKTGPSAPLHSLSCLGSPAPVPDSLQTDLLLSARQLARPGSALSTFGVSCPEPTIPPLDHALSGLLVLLRSSSHPESGMLALDFLHLGLLSPLHAWLRLGPAVLASGRARPDPPLFVPDVGITGSVLPIRQFAHLGLAASTLDYISVGLPLSARSYAWPGPAVLVSDSLQPGFFSFLHSCVWMGLVLLVLDSLTPGPPLLLQARTRPDLAVSALDLLLLGSSTSSRSHGKMGPAMLLSCIHVSDSEVLAFTGMHAEAGML